MSLKIIYDNSDEFLNRAGTLDFEDYIGFELRPDWGDALFLAESLPSLKEFVARNPGYHIVSCSPWLMVNRLVEGMRLYRLAWGGDPDPDLIFVRTRDYWERVTLRATNGRSSAERR
jgi:hypothetical protein